MISSVAIGKFDGLHLGHQSLINALLDFALDSNDLNAKSSQKHCAIIIIDTHLGEFLTSLQDRFEKIKKIDSRLQAFRLDLESVRDFSGGEFVDFLQNLLPNLEKIIVGYDFAFGKNRLFGAEDLREIFQHKHSKNQQNKSKKREVIIIPKVCQNGIPLHSSVVKDLIMHGDMLVANKMLGWKYKIKGNIISGQGIGKKEIFPTINLQVNGYILPANGVYATRTNGLDSVSFIGTRLSTDGKFSIETHILGDFKDFVDFADSSGATNPADFRGVLESSFADFSGAVADFRDFMVRDFMVEVEFVQKLRENRHFDSLSLLKSQITQDICNAKKVLKNLCKKLK